MNSMQGLNNNPFSTHCEVLVYLASVLLLAAVSPADCAAAPAVTPPWTPLSAASLASAGSYTVKALL